MRKQQPTHGLSIPTTFPNSKRLPIHTLHQDKTARATATQHRPTQLTLITHPSRSPPSPPAPPPTPASLHPTTPLSLRQHDLHSRSPFCSQSALSVAHPPPSTRKRNPRQNGRSTRHKTENARHQSLARRDWRDGDWSVAIGRGAGCERAGKAGRTWVWMEGKKGTGGRDCGFHGRGGRRAYHSLRGDGMPILKKSWVQGW